MSEESKNIEALNSVSMSTPSSLVMAPTYFSQPRSVPQHLLAKNF